MRIRVLPSVDRVLFEKNIQLFLSLSFHSLFQLSDMGTVGILNPKSKIQNPDFLKVRFHIVWFSNGRALALAIA